MPSINLNDGGTWKQPREIYLREFNQWFKAKEVFIKENGNWVQVWNQNNQLQNFATGGDVQQIGNYRTHFFTSGTDTFDLQEVSPFAPIEYLIVGGGGPGGQFSPSNTVSNAAGGGGGGQVIIGSEMFSEGQYTVTVGDGGVANYLTVEVGQPSSFNGLTALGGGAGGANYSFNGNPPLPPTNPASSGGADSTLQSGTPHSDGSGFPSGQSNQWGAGGGGGAGSPGSGGGGSSNEDSFNGDGGDGVIVDISGLAVGYGGGGAGISAGDDTALGKDGGGSANQDGTPNTGGGGGAKEGGETRGGSGIVIVRYLYDVAPSFSSEAELSHIGTVPQGTEVSVSYTGGPASPVAVSSYYWTLDGELVSTAASYTPDFQAAGKTLLCEVRLENRLGYAVSASNEVVVQG
jgi:hypothetical protein